MQFKKLHCFIKPTRLRVLTFELRSKDIEAKAEGHRSRVRVESQRQKEIKFDIYIRRLRIMRLGLELENK